MACVSPAFDTARAITLHGPGGKLPEARLNPRNAYFPKSLSKAAGFQDVPPSNETSTGLIPCPRSPALPRTVKP